MALPMRFFPTLMNILSRLAAQGHDNAAAQSYQRPQQRVSGSSSDQGTSGLSVSSAQKKRRGATRPDEKEISVY